MAQRRARLTPLCSGGWLLDRGLYGVHLVIADDHEGTKGAVAGGLPGPRWPPCVVHFQRNVLSHVLAGAMSEVSEDLKAIFGVKREKTARALAEEFIEVCAAGVYRSSRSSRRV